LFRSLSESRVVGTAAEGDAATVAERNPTAGESLGG
jgi:hypothetical protein